MDGAIIIDKPAGLTSHDVVARVRRIINVRRVGHTGTLDPFATGVLVVLVGRATRLAQFLTGADKEYEAIIRLGFATDTGDVTGAPLSTDTDDVTVSSPDKTTRHWTDVDIKTALASLVGEIDQVPPMYSAKKLQGRKLYELARRGEHVEREPVRVTIHSFRARATKQLLKHNNDGTFDVAVHVVCSAGTYVRTLAESFGARLGAGAHLAELRRLRAGAFGISNAVTLDQLKTAAAEDSLGTVLLPPRKVVSEMPFAVASARDTQSIYHGKAIPLEAHSNGVPAEGENVAIRDEEGSLVAVCSYDSASKTAKPRVVLAVEETATDEHR